MNKTDHDVLTYAIDYQEDAIVSKEIINSSALSVTLFAFAKNQGLSEHTSSFEALVIITEGEADVTVWGVGHKLKSGEMLRIPANAAHSLQAAHPFKMILVLIKS